MLSTKSLYKSDTYILGLKSKIFSEVAFNLFFVRGVRDQTNDAITNHLDRKPANLNFSKPRQEADLIFKMPQT